LCTDALEHMNTLGTGRWLYNSPGLVESTHHQLWIHYFAMELVLTVSTLKRKEESKCGK